MERSGRNPVLPACIGSAESVPIPALAERRRPDSFEHHCPPHPDHGAERDDRNQITIRHRPRPDRVFRCGTSTCSNSPYAVSCFSTSSLPESFSNNGQRQRHGCNTSRSVNTVRVMPQTRIVQPVEQMNTFPNSSHRQQTARFDPPNAASTGVFSPSRPHSKGSGSSTDLQALQQNRQNHLSVHRQETTRAYTSESGQSRPQATESGSHCQSTSNSGSVFVALMGRSAPCVIHRNEDGYFVIGPLSPKENGRQLADIRDAGGNLLPPSESTTDSLTGTAPHRISSSNFPPVSGRGGDGRRSTVSVQDTEYERHPHHNSSVTSRETVLQSTNKRYKTDRSAFDGLRELTLPQPVAEDPISANVKRNPCIENQSLCQSGKRKKDTDTSQKLHAVSEQNLGKKTSTSNGEDGSDIIFVGGHFMTDIRQDKVSVEPSSSETTRWQQGTSTVKCQSGSTAPVLSGEPDSQTICLIVSDDEDDVVCLGSQLPSTSTTTSGCLTAHDKAEDQQISTMYENIPESFPASETHFAVRAEQTDAQTGVPSSTEDKKEPGAKHIPSNAIQTDGSQACANNEVSQPGCHSQGASQGTNKDDSSGAADYSQTGQELTCKVNDAQCDTAGAACDTQESQSNLPNELDQPICRVVSIMSLRTEPTSETPLARPLPQLSTEAFYRCGCAGGTCNFQSLMSMQLLMHLVETHMTETSFPCVHCGSQLKSCDALLQHMNRHLDISCLSLYCSDTSCIYNSSSPYCVLTHMATNHPTITSHICWRCSTTFSSLQDFKAHVSQNMLQVVLCPHCSARHTDRRRILDHIVTSHPNKGRAVATHEMLLCEERILTNWLETPVAFDNGGEAAVNSSVAKDTQGLTLVQAESSLRSDKQTGIASDVTVKQGVSQENADQQEAAPLGTDEEMVSADVQEGNQPGAAEAENAKLARLREQWSNESLNEGPVIEIDRAESPTNLDIWDCYPNDSALNPGPSGHSKGGLANNGPSIWNDKTKVSDQMKGSVNEYKSPLASSYREIQSPQQTSVQAAAKSKMVNSHRLQNWMLGSNITEKNSHPSHTTLPLGSRQCKETVHKASPRDFFAMSRKGSVSVFQCLLCLYSSNTRQQLYNSAYARMYHHVRKVHMLDTSHYQCPFCNYRRILRKDVLHHARVVHPEKPLPTDITQTGHTPAQEQDATGPDTPQTAAIVARSTAQSSCKAEAEIHQNKAIVPRDLYSIQRRGGSKVMQCLCCGHTVTGSRVSMMTMHVWQHMDRFKCFHCSYKAYPISKVRHHIKNEHPGKVMQVIDTAEETTTSSARPGYCEN